MPGGSTGEGTLLFGGSGFLGPYILERSPAMISVGRTPPPTANMHVHVDSLADLAAIDEIPFDKVVFIVGNTDHHGMEREVIPPGEPTAFDYHLTPLLQAMEQLKRYPITKVIHFSTILLYDEKQISLPVSEHAPIDPYKNRYVLSKYLAEEACKFYARWLPIVNVRFSNLYGPTPLKRHDLIHVLVNQLLDEGRGVVWSAKPERDFIYVEDAAEAIIHLLDADYTGTLNLGTGVMTSVGTIVELLAELSGCPIEVLDKPVEGPLRFQCDLTTLERIIDWRPQYPVAEGVRRTWERTKADRAVSSQP
jgi:nucleoside-diphosphate-sugar epimerase